MLHYVVADFLNLMRNLLLGLSNLVRNLLLGHPQVMLNLLSLLSKEAELFSASSPQGRPLRRSEHLLLSLGHERKSSDVYLSRVVLRSCFKLFSLISASRHRLSTRFLSSSPTRACTGCTGTCSPCLCFFLLDAAFSSRCLPAFLSQSRHVRLEFGSSTTAGHLLLGCELTLFEH